MSMSAENINIKYFTHTQLRTENVRAKLDDKERTISIDLLSGLPTDRLYPISEHVVKDDCIRATIALNERGDTAELDLTFDGWDALPSKEATRNGV